jgi:hypothetical protein
MDPHYFCKLGPFPNLHYCPNSESLEVENTALEVCGRSQEAQNGTMEGL